MGREPRLRGFRVDAVTGAQDALGETLVVLELGIGPKPVSGSGQAVFTDILEAAARAYLHALSGALRRREVLGGRSVEAQAVSFG